MGFPLTDVKEPTIASFLAPRVSAGERTDSPQGNSEHLPASSA